MCPNALDIIKELIKCIKENVVSICSNWEKFWEELLKPDLQWRKLVCLYNLQKTFLVTMDSLLMSLDLVKTPLRESV